MGCFNQISFLSNLPLTSGTPTVLIFIKKEGDGHACYSTDNYRPILLPIFGEYDDYGRIENIEMDNNVKFIEDFFNTTIDNLIKIVDDRMIGRGRKTNSEFEELNNHELLDDVYFCLEHRNIYDFLVKENTKMLWKDNARNTIWFLEDLLKLEKINEKYDERYKETYRIKNNDNIVIISDSGSVNFYDIVKKKNIKDFDHINEDMWYMHHPSDFLEAYSYYSGDHSIYHNVFDYYNTTLSQHYYNINVHEKVNNKKENEKLFGISEDVLNKFILKRSGSECVLTSEEFEIYKDWLMQELRNSMRDNSYFKNEYKGSMRESHSGGLNLYHIYGEKLYDGSLKNEVIDMMDFHSSIGINSLTYKLSSYGNQGISHDFFVSFFKTCYDISENSLKECEDYEDV